MLGIKAVLVSLMFALSACGAAGPFDDMQPGESGRVVRVIDGDALVLDTGQSVRLIAIEAPALRPRDRDPDPNAVEAARLLEDLVLGRDVQLYYSGLTRDRYDRALAHVVTTGQLGPEYWLNMEMIRQGGARVRFYPDTALRTDEFLAAEQEARSEKIGLWSKSAYAIKPAENLDADHRGFTLLVTTLGPRRAPGEHHLDRVACQRLAASSDLIIEVSRDAWELCTRPEGTALRLRGRVSDGRMDLALPVHAEPLD